MSGPGHNGGPGLDGGQSWRRHCWRAAREALLPKLPVEVIRTRVRRAGELGLDYRTYAGVRAQSGHDVIALLFSTNALRLLRDGDRMAAGDAARLAATCGVARLLAAQPPLEPAAAQPEDLDLEARRAGVDDEDGVHHAGRAAAPRRALA